jgi:hypothetical protein
LVALKFHSGRLTDARDAFALIEDIGLDDVANHIEGIQKSCATDVSVPSEGGGQYSGPTTSRYTHTDEA